MKKYMTVSEWCRRYNLSRTMFYRYKLRGWIETHYDHGRRLIVTRSLKRFETLYHRENQ